MDKRGGNDMNDSEKKTKKSEGKGKGAQEEDQRKEDARGRGSEGELFLPRFWCDVTVFTSYGKVSV